MSLIGPADLDSSSIDSAMNGRAALQEDGINQLDVRSDLASSVDQKPYDVSVEKAKSGSSPIKPENEAQRVEIKKTETVVLETLGPFNRS